MVFGKKCYTTETLYSFSMPQIPSYITSHFIEKYSILHKIQLRFACYKVVKLFNTPLILFLQIDLQRIDLL